MKRLLSGWWASRALVQNLREWITAGADLLFPPHCAGCGVPGDVWCAGCDAGLERLRRPLCRWCGRHLPRGKSCSSCTFLTFPVRSYALYRGPLIRALVQLKYRPDRRLAARMGSWLAEIVRREGWQADLIVPVPLAPQRLRQRGYNQATIVASAFAEEVGWPMVTDGLQRIRETPSQVGLGLDERWRNMRGAFKTSQNFSGQVVLLVDDLYTTGATLTACATALQRANAQDVLGLTVGRAR